MQPDIHTGSEPQHSANPDTPPPEYSILVTNHQGPLLSHPSQHVLEQSLFNSRSGPPFTPPSRFGPTPLMQSRPTLGVLPYYDPHSTYAIEAATLRAKQRFIGAASWAIGLVICLSLLGALRGLHHMTL